jgi:hypothetical protein
MAWRTNFRGYVDALYFICGMLLLMLGIHASHAVVQGVWLFSLCLLAPGLRLLVIASIWLA